MANLHVNPIVCFTQNSPEDLQSLVQSSRIFKELDFSEYCFYLRPVAFSFLENFLSFTGPQIKRLLINCSEVNYQILQKLINLFPNLKSLELRSLLVYVEDDSKKRVKWDINLTKLESVKIVDGNITPYDLIEPLAKCPIKEADLQFGLPLDTNLISNFLDSHEKSLKKLTLDTGTAFPENLKNMKLELFKFSNRHLENISLECLRHHPDLTSLVLHFRSFSDGNLNLIWELKNLEVLELNCEVEIPGNNKSILNNIHKLAKLKRLKIHGNLTENILDHLQFGVLKDLEDLVAWFYDDSIDGSELEPEKVKMLKRNAPNLKRIKISSDFPHTINVLLENLENLESVTISCEELEEPFPNPELICPKIKYLKLKFPFQSSVGQITKLFPNLETLIMSDYIVTLTKSDLLELLNGLKHLKKLHLRVWDEFEAEINSKFFLEYIPSYNKNLSEVEIADRDCDGSNIETTRNSGFEITECAEYYLKIKNLNKYPRALKRKID